MARDDSKQELHLIPSGWIVGNRWVNDRQTQTVETPADRIETWVEEICDSSEGWDPPTVFWKITWLSPDVTVEARAEINIKFPRPAYKPWVKPPRRSRKIRRTVYDY